MTDDQKAFVYVTLCLSRFNQIKREWEQGVEEERAPGMGGEVTREDLTYVWKACNALGDWNRPSIFAIREPCGVFVSCEYGPRLMGERRDAVLFGSVYNRDEHVDRDEGAVGAEGMALDRAGSAQGGDGVAVRAT